MAYLAVMLAVAVVGLVAAHSVRVAGAFAQHDAEEELLAIGMDLQAALQRYANASPAGAPRAPQALEDLLKDPRYPGLVRHLRHVPADPFTGRADWVLVRDSQRLIVGVHSDSPAQPLKQAGFPPALAHLDGKRASYREWVFLGVPP